jgi:outer membrane protein OmpA-like peptidoglycan-associated protein
MLDRVSKALTAALLICGVSAAGAQTSTPPSGSGQSTGTTQPTTATQTTTATAQTTTPEQPTETRPATPTMFGDTGLWFVPTGEILPARKWSLSLYRVDWNYNQGFTNGSFWPVTFGVGLGDRAELFASVRSVVRLDRDIRPLFQPVTPDQKFGGAVVDYPNNRTTWTGNQFGDVYLGAKVNLLSEYRQQPVAFGIRGMLKLPTADENEGVGTGKMDVLLDAILSKELNERVELSGYAGFISRGNPDNWDLTNGFRWGIGAGFPTRKSLRFTAELYGEQYSNDTITYTGTPITAVDGTVLPSVSNASSPLHGALGLTWQHRKGAFIGAGLDWNMNVDGRTDAGSQFGNVTGDAVGFQLRAGYHPGVRIYVAPPPPPPPPAPPQNNPPSVKARCEPCSVEVGKSSTVTADAQDPDGDQLNYKWSAPTGTLQNPNDRQTLWTAPMEPGPVPLTVTVDDGKGGTASDTVTIQVTRPPVKEFVFEDVHFDFDRYSLRPEATRILDEAVKALQDNPELRLEVEGHTCNIGTAEYNLALGERRANAVRDYLASRGIGADRLRTVSYGEERPKHDNSREETRRLNRRAAMIVRIQR